MRSLKNVVGNGVWAEINACLIIIITSLCLPCLWTECSAAPTTVVLANGYNNYSGWQYALELTNAMAADADSTSIITLHRTALS
jgi:hypothetical protein